MQQLLPRASHPLPVPSKLNPRQCVFSDARDAAVGLAMLETRLAVLTVRPACRVSMT